MSREQTAIHFVLRNHHIGNKHHMSVLELFQGNRLEEMFTTTVTEEIPIQCVKRRLKGALLNLYNPSMLLEP